MADLDWPAVLRAVADSMSGITATSAIALHHAADAAAAEIERQQVTAQEPAATTEDHAAPSPAPAPNRCVHCRREVGPSPGWHECAPPIADTDGLDGAEKMLRRLADSGDYVLLSGEAGLIVDELDRLRFELARLYAERADLHAALAAKEQQRWDEHDAAERHLREHDAAERHLRERDAARAEAGAFYDAGPGIVERGRRLERAAIVAWLRKPRLQPHLAAAIERGEHLEDQP